MIVARKNRFKATKACKRKCCLGLVLYRPDPGASTPLTGGGKCLLEKVTGSKKLKTGEIFLVADFRETHNTECDNSAYNSPIFCSPRSQITFSLYF